MHESADKGVEAFVLGAIEADARDTVDHLLTRSDMPFDDAQDHHIRTGGDRTIA
jgi:hypothetical protein